MNLTVSSPVIPGDDIGQREVGGASSPVNNPALAPAELVELGLSREDSTDLTILDLSGSGLSELPESLGQLTNLSVLDLNRNRLSELPAWLGQLTNLSVLDLGGNRLSELPESLGQLTNLIRLNLSGNRLSGLPAWLGQLTNLTVLELSGNRLSGLPAWLGQLTNVTFLELSGNQLSELPESLGQLTNLTELDLGHNQLSELPEWLGWLDLQNLDVADNPLAPELVAADTERRLLPFLQALAEDGISVADGKLILVGEGEAGKSTLLAALRGEPFRPDRSATHGLEVKTVEITGSSGELALRAWDFGGQKQYRPTHQLFFSAPAVYLVVWRPRPGPESGQVEYWIDQIRHRAGLDAPILVVATHADTDAPPPDIDGSRLLATYGKALRGFHHVGSATGIGIPQLRDAIAEVAGSLPHFRRILPRHWLATRDLLFEDPQPYITRDRFTELAAGFGLDAVDSDTLARIGHTLGWWVHYADDVELCEIIVLKGDWLSRAIAQVVDDAATRRSHGLLVHTRLQQIWNNPAQPPGFRYELRFHRAFLQLMELFDIAYRAPDKPNRRAVSLVPQLLPTGAPDLRDVWTQATPTECTAFCQPVIAGTNETAIPDGIMPRFIVRNHWLSLGAEDIDKALHWRGGVVLQDRYSARAIVELHRDGINVTARGPHPGGLVNGILESLRELIGDFWPGLSANVLIPCPECHKSRMFNLDRLYDRLRSDRPTAECPNCFALVPVLHLISQLPSPLIDLQDDHLKALSAQLAEIQAQVDEGVVLSRDLQAAMQKLHSQANTNLQILLSAVADEAKNGPRLFTVRPIGRSITLPQITHIRIRVTLYCEHSLRPVYQLDNDPTAGVIDVDVPKDWWQKAKPWIKRAGLILSPFTAVGGASLQLALDDPTWSGVGETVGFGEAITNTASDGLKALSTQAEDPEDPGEGRLITDPIRADGAELRRLHEILKAKDPAFADLRLVQGPTGYLWVHRTFVHMYSRGG
jgi:C-terminal of Roc, COR, domain/Ras of Complex, Roc, domain of DAPkinase/Leucine rich repeat/Leucine Rich repeats (2 copies)